MLYGTSTKAEIPFVLQMLALTMGFVPSRVLYVVTKAGVPEALADLGAATAEEIAAALPEPVHAPHLFRMMHLLSSLGVYKMDRKGRFSSTRYVQWMRCMSRC
jgi:hypothetical protein